MWTRIRRLLKKWGTSLSSKGPGFWRFVDSVPVLRRFFNRLFINLITNSTKPRPHPFSLWTPAATADAPGMLGWRALLIASGSRSGVL